MTHPYHPTNVGWRGFIASTDSPGLRIFKNKNDASPLSLSSLTSLSLSYLANRNDPFESMYRVANDPVFISNKPNDKRGENGISSFYSE